MQVCAVSEIPPSTGPPAKRFTLGIHRSAEPDVRYPALLELGTGHSGTVLKQVYGLQTVMDIVLLSAKYNKLVQVPS